MIILRRHQDDHFIVVHKTKIWAKCQFIDTKVHLSYWRFSLSGGALGEVGGENTLPMSGTTRGLSNPWAKSKSDCLNDFHCLVDFGRPEVVGGDGTSGTSATISATIKSSKALPSICQSISPELADVSAYMNKRKTAFELYSLLYRETKEEESQIFWAE